MPSAANAKSEKPAPLEAVDNSPIRQIMTIIEHKIRNLEKRKSKLISYRDLQKSGKELNSDQKIAVAKYDEVAQTLEFARDLSKQITGIAMAAERDAKKQAKREAWVRNTSDTNKIRDVLLVLDCLMQMGNTEVQNDFLIGSNGAAKLTKDDLKVLEDLYPEVTPSHKLNVEGQSEFHQHVSRAANHLYAIIDGQPKEVLGTTYTHIKEIVGNVHECGYFDKGTENVAVPNESEEEHLPVMEEECPEPIEEIREPELGAPYPIVGALPVPPAAAVVPAPAYPLRAMPPITLQEVEHAYFAQQYPQQRPIAEVIGSQNFFFLQESEIDSPVGTPQPPPIPNQLSPPGPIPTQTFTNQHFVQMPRVPEPGALPLPPQPHFPAHPEHAGYPPAPIPMAALQHMPQTTTHAIPHPVPQQMSHILVPMQPSHSEVGVPEVNTSASPLTDKEDDGHKDRGSPDQDDNAERKMHNQNGQNRFRRYGRSGGRTMSNGHRGRGTYPNRQSGDGYRNRQSGEYQNRSHKDVYQNRQYDNYQPRHGKDNYTNRSGNDGYYGNGDAADIGQHGDNVTRDRYAEGNQHYQGGFKSRGRGPRGAPRGTSRPPRSQQFNRKPDNNE